MYIVSTCCDSVPLTVMIETTVDGCISVETKTTVDGDGDGEEEEDDEEEDDDDEVEEDDGVTVRYWVTKTTSFDR